MPLPAERLTKSTGGRLPPLDFFVGIAEVHLYDDYGEREGFCFLLEASEKTRKELDAPQAASDNESTLWAVSSFLDS